MPSVLFINRVFPPDEGATGQLLAELAVEMAKAGWQVTVVAGNAALTQAVHSSIVTSRVAGLPFSRASMWRRALSYLSLYPALLWRVLRLPRHDFVITLTDPPLHLALAPIIRATKGSRLLHWAQDLYPEVAEELQAIRRHGGLASILRRISTWSLQRHDAVIAVGRCMAGRLRQRGVPAERLRVVPNWSLQAPATEVAPEPEAFRRTQGWEHRFVVMYSGNLGLAHPFEAILNAIEILGKKEPRILFVLVGEGSQLVKLRQRLATAPNVCFLPRQPISLVGTTLRAADVHLASMFEHLAGLVVPSKVYGIVVAERPCVFLGPQESEAARLLRDHKCGLVLPSGDGEGLANVLLEWSHNPAALESMRANARQVAPQLGVGPALQSFQEVLGSVAKG
jgi:glycosyltransferase involved in cell wall biosynthesis